MFGQKTWIVFFKNIPKSFDLIQYSLPLDYQPTILHALLLLRCNPDIAKALHLIVMLTILSLTTLIWIKKSSPLYLRTSLLVIGSTLVSPYFSLHDLVILSLPIAWLGWKIYEKRETSTTDINVLVLAWIFPLMTPLSNIAKIQLAPIILIALFFFVWRRARKLTPLN
jgi:hypothetical protein